METLPVKIHDESLRLLTERTDLALQKAAINKEIENISGRVDIGKFSQLISAEDYVRKLNAKTDQIDSNEDDQQAAIRSINAAQNEIKSLEQKSNALSWTIIIIIIVIVLFLMIK